MKNLQHLLQPFFVALQFLTIIPIKLRADDFTTALKYSLVYYPLVGLCIGFALSLLAWLCSSIAPAISAVCLLILWVFLTGALHLDGLADTADGWVGGHGERERTLAIMKDPASGPIAICAVVLILLLKYASLEVLLTGSQWLLIMAVPVIGRLAVMSVIATVPYIRAAGLGTVLSVETPKKIIWTAMLVSVVVLLCFSPLTMTMALLLAAGITVLLACIFMRRLGGMTGDIYGAVIEIVEAAVLMLFAILN